MNPIDIVRAWKDKAYRESLTEVHRQALPANPAGAVELGPEEIAAVAGSSRNPTLGKCGNDTNIDLCTGFYGCGR